VTTDLGAHVSLGGQRWWANCFVSWRQYEAGSSSCKAWTQFWALPPHSSILFPRTSNMDVDTVGQQSLLWLLASQSTYCAHRLGHCWAADFRISSASFGTMHVVWHTCRRLTVHVSPSQRTRSQPLTPAEAADESCHVQQHRRVHFEVLQGTSSSHIGSTSFEIL